MASPPALILSTTQGLPRTILLKGKFLYTTQWLPRITLLKGKFELFFLDTNESPTSED